MNKNYLDLISKGIMILGLTLGGTTLNSCSARRATTRYPVKSVLEEKILEPQISKEIPDAPVYNYPDKHCARYAFQATREIFNKKFIWGHAWNTRYNNKIIATPKNKRELVNFIEQGVLKPGMIVGVYYPFSSCLNEIDQTRKKAKYTHLAVYAGINEKSEPVFYHQFKGKETKVTLNQLTKGIGSIKEILDEK